MGRACLVAVGVAARGSAGRRAKSAQHSGELVLVVYHVQERDTADNRRRLRLATGLGTVSEAPRQQVSQAPRSVAGYLRLAGLVHRAGAGGT